MFPIEFQLGNALKMVITTLWLVPLLFGAYKLFDWLTPIDLKYEIFEEQNIAIGIIIGCLFLAIAIAIS